MMIVFTACHDREAEKAGTEGMTEPGNIADKAPPIYLEQMVVALKDGRPLVESG